MRTPVPAPVSHGAIGKSPGNCAAHAFPYPLFSKPLKNKNDTGRTHDQGSQFNLQGLVGRIGRLVTTLRCMHGLRPFSTAQSVRRPKRWPRKSDCYHMLHEIYKVSAVHSEYTVLVSLIFA